MEMSLLDGQTVKFQVNKSRVESGSSRSYSNAAPRPLPTFAGTELTAAELVPVWTLVQSSGLPCLIDDRLATRVEEWGQ